MTSGSGTMVEQLTQNLKVKGLNPSDGKHPTLHFLHKYRNTQAYYAIFRSVLKTVPDN
jgi:hypothetical protein